MDENVATVGESFTLELPEGVVSALGLELGDEVYFDIDSEGVYISRQTAASLNRACFPSDQFSKWLSPEDDAAYADL